MHGAPFGLGLRVRVPWADGRSYGGVVSAVHAGHVQVRWDAGGAAWIPAAHVRPEGAEAPARGAPAAQGAWGWQPPPGAHSPAPPQPHAAAGPAAAFAPPVAAPAAKVPTSQLPRSPGPPPKPVSGTQPGDLARGLVYEPTGRGPGTGKVFFVFFGFLSVSDNDLDMRMSDINHLGDDVAALRAAGFRVVLELFGDKDGLDRALRGEHPDASGLDPVGVLWSSHGNEDGTVSNHEGGTVAPEALSTSIATKGTIKLFVMSACFAGKHSGRWQKALGQQALVIGWGAPITNERAVDFLTPDDASSKDFDDLLVRHLGVPRVAADGPLVELKELAEEHEKRLAVLRVPHEELVKRAVEWLKFDCKPGKKRDVFVGVRIPPPKGKDARARLQMVRVGPMGMHDEFVHLTTMIGPYSEALDLPRALREIVDTMRTRIVLVKTAPENTEFVAAESLLIRRGLDHVALGRVILQVGVMGDRLEDLFFGSDRF